MYVVCMYVCMKVTACTNLRTSIWGDGLRYADRSRTCTCAWSLSGPRPACGGGGNSARACGERRRCSRTCMRSPLSTSTSSPPWLTIDRYTYTKIFIHANLNTCIIIHTYICRSTTYVIGSKKQVWPYSKDSVLEVLHIAMDCSIQEWYPSACYITLGPLHIHCPWNTAGLSTIHREINRTTILTYGTYAKP